ncbi:MAG: type II secretion system protein [Gemmatimonadaceae bacterium]
MLKRFRRHAGVTDAWTGVCGRRVRHGFSLPEILVALAIIATLSVVVLPAVMNKLTEARAAALSQTLDGINKTVQSYRGNVGRYPRYLRQLSEKPATAGALAADLCGSTTPLVNINQWRGPYSSRTFTDVGTQVGDATVQDGLRRVPSTTPPSFAVAYVDVINVDEAVASSVNRAFDGDGNYNAGTILWVPATPPMGTLSFGIPVRGC